MAFYRIRLVGQATGLACAAISVGCGGSAEAVSVAGAPPHHRAPPPVRSLASGLHVHGAPPCAAARLQPPSAVACGGGWAGMATWDDLDEEKIATIPALGRCVAPRERRLAPAGRPAQPEKVALATPANRLRPPQVGKARATRGSPSMDHSPRAVASGMVRRPMWTWARASAVTAITRSSTRSGGFTQSSTDPR